MNPFNELLLVGAAQGLLLGVVILSLRTTNPAANRLLALFVALESLHLLFLYAVYSFSSLLPSQELSVLFGLRVLDAPALYLYVRALTEERFRFDASQLKHLLVLVPMILFSAHLGYSTDWARTSALALQYDSTTVSWSLYHSLIFGGYGLQALWRLNRYLRRMEQALSSIESISLRWLRGLLFAVVAADIVNVGYDVLRLLHVVGPEPKVAFNLFTTLSMVYWLSIGGLRQQAIFTEPVRTALAAIDRDAVDVQAVAPPSSDRLAKSGLDPETIDRLWQQLQELLERDRPHLDPLLDLPRLARQIGRRPQELSLVINSCSGGTFYDLINGYRVEAAKQLLLDGSRRRKMLDIALSVGFSSQSTFYHQFKKATGVTPTVFRDRQSGPALHPST